MRRVIVESPYAATEYRSLAQHKAYLNAAMKDCLLKGDAPFASHLVIPDVLDDTNQLERAIGIEVGLVWGCHAEAILVYSQLGVSDGMKAAISHYKKLGIPIEWRGIDNKTFDAILNM